jgi:tRNA U38,U39,U40 pseudouridine synthase TruA
VLEYDGSAFKGSQLQSSVRTVQGELEIALKKILFGSLPGDPDGEVT